jgi:uncharacterized protein
VSAPRERAFRFVGAGFAPGSRGGITITAAGGVAMVEGDESIRQAIIMLMSTRPGERVMRPAYGSNLDRLIFAPNNDTTAGLAIHYVRQALQRWEPRVEVLDIDAQPDPDDAWRLNIQLKYRVRASLSTGIVAYSVDLGTHDEGDAL